MVGYSLECCAERWAPPPLACSARRCGCLGRKRVNWPYTNPGGSTSCGLHFACPIECHLVAFSSIKLHPKNANELISVCKSGVVARIVRCRTAIDVGPHRTHHHRTYTHSHQLFTRFLPFQCQCHTGTDRSNGRSLSVFTCASECVRVLSTEPFVDEPCDD